MVYRRRYPWSMCSLRSFRHWCIGGATLGVCMYVCMYERFCLNCVLPSSLVLYFLLLSASALNPYRARGYLAASKPTLSQQVSWLGFELKVLWS